MPDGRITALQEKLRAGASELAGLLLELERESALLPYDWEIQDQLRSARFYSKSVEHAIALVLKDPVAREDITLLHELDDKTLCVGQTLCVAQLSILAKLTIQRSGIDPVVRGSWAMDEQLTIDGALRLRLSALLQSVGFCMRHIVQIREPGLYPWKALRPAPEISRLADTAQSLERELTGLLSGHGTGITYGRYLQLETVLDSYEHFEAYALKKHWAH